MRKNELIKKICALSQHEPEELRDWSKEELEELLEELTDDSDLYPNGRDFDDEDEDF